ncbi:CinA-like protein [Myxococcaceae bacterium]|jgi:molybdenum cofactor synthesis domain-containing protein|nr:CinA-like protein [Myxococcaceae bacterium]
MSSAGIIIVGNEILSGKVADTNSHYLCKELRALGVDVERVAVIPDVIDTIAAEVRSQSAAFDHVFTSGGVGPTHDDVTLDGVAKAFGVDLVLNEALAARIERAQGSRPNESQLKMAKIPAGAMLVDAGDLWLPVVIVKNVHVFPGIPGLLQKKFESVKERFRGIPFKLRRVYLSRRESEIAEVLNRVLAEFPEVLMGSYPRTGREDFFVMVTLESRDDAYLQRSLDVLLERLPEGSIQRVE